MEQAALLQPVTELVLKFAQMAVPALLDAALESTRAPTGMFGKLFRRPTIARRVQAGADLQPCPAPATDGGQRGRHAQPGGVGTEPGLAWVALAVVSTLAGGALDATLADALVQRRTLIQQAVRQAELSIMQMGQVRQQAADLIGQVSSFLTVTLPALEMAQAQGGN